MGSVPRPRESGLPAGGGRLAARHPDFMGCKMPEQAGESRNRETGEAKTRHRSEKVGVLRWGERDKQMRGKQSISTGGCGDERSSVLIGEQRRSHRKSKLAGEAANVFVQDARLQDARRGREHRGQLEKGHAP